MISELVKLRPSEAVVEFLRASKEEFYTAAICKAELAYGIEKLPAGRRRVDLTAALDALFADAFVGRVLAFDTACANAYGFIRARREKAGSPISVQDAMVAATAAAYGATLATRNLRDFVDCAIETIDPWVKPPL